MRARIMPGHHLAVNLGDSMEFSGLSAGAQAGKVISIQEHGEFAGRSGGLGHGVTVPNLLSGWAINLLALKVDKTQSIGARQRLEGRSKTGGYDV